jgi:hypothetical protein
LPFVVYFRVFTNICHVFFDFSMCLHQLLRACSRLALGVSLPLCCFPTHLKTCHDPVNFHWGHKHKQQNKICMLLWGFQRQKRKNFLSNLLLFYISLRLQSCTCAYVDAYVAHFTAFLCFVLTCAYAYVASENQVIKRSAGYPDAKGA